jgi:WS/DGAT/MGAT family acyltransferase
LYKLGALDAGFLYNETDKCPQHIASVQVLELPDGVLEETFVERLKALLMSRIHLVPYFTNRLQMVPFELDHPVWVRDLDFDINNHVHTVALAAPGDRAAFEQKIAELHEELFDRSRPLWGIWVLTGLEGGRVAYYNKAHHACLDGMAGQAMLQTIMDTDPEPREVEPAPHGFLQQRDQQSGAALLAGAVENFARYQSKQPLAIINAVETIARLVQRTFDPRKGIGAALEGAPKIRFNGAVEAKRSYSTGELSVAQMKSIANVSQTKLNDVFLAVVAGGLRRYLARGNELPDRSLVAGCPVSVRKPGDESTGNQVTMMLVSLATQETDPVRALQSIARSSLAAKGLTADLSHSYDADVALPGMPGVLRAGLRVVDRTALANLPAASVPCNVVVSNVPGPQIQLYSCGAKVLTHYPVSIPAHGQALNITVQSYVGQMFFGVTACAKALPDADRLRDDMLAAYAELAEAHGVETDFAAPGGALDVHQPEDVALQQIDLQTHGSDRASDSSPARDRAA